jgi:hypothetical protein
MPRFDTSYKLPEILVSIDIKKPPSFRLFHSLVVVIVSIHSTCDTKILFDYSLEIGHNLPGFLGDGNTRIDAGDGFPDLNAAVCVLKT